MVWDRTIERQLPVNFTLAELREISKNLAHECVALEGVEAEKKAANEKFKDRIDGHRNRIKDAAKKINTGQENRLVECGVEKDHAHNLIRFVRLDTMETVEERAMTKEERQHHLNLPPQGPAPDEPEGQEAARH